MSVESRPYSLAIESSSRSGAVALGRGDRILAVAPIPTSRRHDLELVPTIDRLCREHGADPGAIGEIHVSIGPGSFTGLRMGIATAKLLCRALGARAVAVPTLEILAQNALADPEITRRTAIEPASKVYIATCVALKADTVYARVFEVFEGELRPIGEPAASSLADWLNQCPRPTRLFGFSPENTIELSEGVSVADAPYDQPAVEALWRLGRLAAARGAFVDPLALAPLYVRRPEAEEVWDARERAASQP